MGTDKDNNLISAAELRRQAEERLLAKTAERHPHGITPDTQRLVHELEVHQIELEMQNAELTQARDKMEAALNGYTDLYDFAPVGYLTLDREGTVRASNLAAAGLLESERSRLLGRRFGLFVAAEDRLRYAEFFGRVFAGEGKVSCEVRLAQEDTSPLVVQIEAAAAASGEECRVAVIDITERKEAQQQIMRQNAELQAANGELNRFASASVGRELRMIELKKEINELYVQSGRPPRYPLVFEN
jgi:PAS domain S-box-containing protein